jgi:hypothetical protein
MKTGMAYQWGNAALFTPFSLNLPMKQIHTTKILLVLTAVMFALGSTVSAAETIKPFNGKDLTGWKFNGRQENVWKAGGLNADARTFEFADLKAGETACLSNFVDVNWNRNPRKGVDIYTEQKFGDCTIKLEFLITKGSNSGVYLMGEYEVQVADSFGKPDDKLSQGDMGAVYSAAAPKINACGEPGTWQTYEIVFVAPKFDADGKKTANGLFKKIVLNGKVVLENIEVEKPTGGGVTMKEAPTGPLMLQGNHGPVAYRNIEIIVP